MGIRLSWAIVNKITALSSGGKLGARKKILSAHLSDAALSPSGHENVSLVQHNAVKVFLLS